MSKPSLHESILRDSLAEELGLTASMRVLPERSTRTNLFQALDSQMQEINAQLTVHPDIEVPKYTRKDFTARMCREMSPLLLWCRHNHRARLSPLTCLSVWGVPSYEKLRG